MRIGVPTEIKTLEYRVGMTPAGAGELVASGHQVFIQQGAAAGIDIADADYVAVGATILSTAEELYATADMIVKVKEPQLEECKLLRPGQLLFTYLHLAADPAQAEALLSSGATAIAYETVTDGDGSLPLLTPMSEVAGRLSIQAGAVSLQKAAGGRGVLLGGVPGVKPANILVLGGGVAGANAADMAVGLGATVTIVDRSLPRLRQLDAYWGGRVNTVYSTTGAIDELSATADLVIGAVLVAGATAPKLLTAKNVRDMQAGSVLVDISIDQGGCFETSRPSTHLDPTFVVDDVVHYCVTNMPGAVPRTSTFALTNATLPFIKELAELGWAKALRGSAALAAGLNIHAGRVTHQAVANDLAYDYLPADTALKSA